MIKYVINKLLTNIISGLMDNLLMFTNVKYFN